MQKMAFKIGFRVLILAASFGVGLSAKPLRASPLAESPYVIPFANIRPEASDLVLNGKHLLPLEVAALRDEGVDISLINPDASTDLWNPTGAFPNFSGDESLEVSSGDRVQFVETLEAPIKIFRFIVQKEIPGRGSEVYQILLGKRLQTYLLRRNLLRKLGYYIPPMKQIAHLSVEFLSSNQKLNFIEDRANGLKWNAGGDEEWITNLKDKDSKILELQDVMVLPATAEFTNLAFGYIRADINQGRRIINALLVPYNLVDVQESVNGLRWHSAQIKSQTIYFPLEDEEAFSATMADGHWIMRSILKLDRTDWQEIVSGIGYPDAVQALLVEKLISRRNELRRLINMPGEDLPYNPNVSYGNDLVDGELLTGKYDGVAGRMAMDEATSLISGSEMRSLIVSKGFSTAVSGLVRKVNDSLILGTNLAEIAQKKQVDAFFDDLIEHIKTGNPIKRHLGVWVAPYYSGQLIASREIVAGSYMGTDNRVQLVDTFGVGLETGLFMGTTGLAPQQTLNATAKVSYVRTYSHLKPITSIRASLADPYQNIFVPSVQHKWAALIDPRALVKSDNQTEEEWKKNLSEMAELFKDNLQPGESLIITDNISSGLGAAAGYQFTDRIRAQMAFEAGLTALSRLHIQRDGDRINIYKDYGNLKSLQLSIVLRAQIEVLQIRTKVSKGIASTDFYSLNLDPDYESNPDLPLVLSGMRELLVNTNIRKINLIETPHRLEHKIKQTETDVKFLFWHHLKLDQEDRLKLTRANELEPEYYVRRLMGKRNGADFQTVSIDVLNETISEMTGQEVTISNVNSGDPGETIFGKSKARYAYFEGDLTPGKGYKEQFVAVNYRWRGWSSNRQALEKIVQAFSDRFEFNFFHPEAFKQIKAAELYSLNLRIFVYDMGVKNVINLGFKQLKGLLDAYSSKKGNKQVKLDYQRKVLREFYFLQQKYLKARPKKDFDKMGDVAVEMVSLLESALDHEGLLEAVGGLQNILIQPILTGYFKGEDGKMAERPIEGNEIGQIGSRRRLGPMTTVQNEVGMTESEFFVYWLLRRI